MTNAGLCVQSAHAVGALRGERDKRGSQLRHARMIARYSRREWLVSRRSARATNAAADGSRGRDRSVVLRRGSSNRATSPSLPTSSNTQPRRHRQQQDKKKSVACRSGEEVEWRWRTANGSETHLFDNGLREGLTHGSRSIGSVSYRGREGMEETRRIDAGRKVSRRNG